MEKETMNLKREELKKAISAINLENLRHIAEEEMPEALNEAREKKENALSRLKAIGFTEFYNSYKEDERLGGDWALLKRTLRKTKSEGIAMSIARTITSKVWASYEERLDELFTSVRVPPVSGDEGEEDKQIILTPEVICTIMEEFLLADRAHRLAVNALRGASAQFDKARAKKPRLESEEDDVSQQLRQIRAAEVKKRQAEEEERMSEDLERSLPKNEGILIYGIPDCAVLQGCATYNKNKAENPRRRRRQ